MALTLNRLTDRQVKALKAATKSYDKADGGDLYVRVEPSGAKVFWLRYQIGNQRRRLTIGRYPELSLVDARAMRDDARKTLRDGIDPVWQRLEAQRAAMNAQAEMVTRYTMTVGALVAEFCERELPVIHKRPSWGVGLLRVHVVAHLEALPVADLTPAKLWLCLDPLRAAQPATARHVFGLVRKLCSFAKRRGYLTIDPSAEIERRAVAPKPAPRQRVLSDDEIRAAWNTSLALRLLLATGQRRGEVTRAKRAEFDLDAGFWLIPAERLGKKKGAAMPHLVPLSPLAVSIVRDIIATAPASEWLLPAPKDASKPMDERALNHLLARRKIEWTPHDLRRTMRTRLSRLGVNAVVAERIIGHELPALMAVYDVHAYEDEKRQALTQWGEHLATIVLDSAQTA